MTAGAVTSSIFNLTCNFQLTWISPFKFYSVNTMSNYKSNQLVDFIRKYKK